MSAVHCPEAGEEFFERLAEKAWSQLRGTRNDLFHPAVKEFVSEGINATREALKEIMVGEPIRCRAWLCKEKWGEEWTKIYLPQGVGDSIAVGGHHGTDGEEVVVLVVRLE